MENQQNLHPSENLRDGGLRESLNQVHTELMQGVQRQTAPQPVTASLAVSDSELDTLLRHLGSQYVPLITSFDRTRQAAGSLGDLRQIALADIQRDLGQMLEYDLQTSLKRADDLKRAIKLTEKVDFS